MRTIKLIKRDGKVDVETDLAAFFSTLRNGVYHLIIKREKETRTINQNNLMWMWFACIEQETGTDKQDVYLYYCKKFLCKVIQVGERLEKVVETSSMLNTQRMTDFLKKVQADAASELGITLPLPEDRYFECFYQRYKQ